MAEKAIELLTPEDKIDEAKELFSRGSRNFVMGYYKDAAEDLSQCCEMFVKEYGEKADEMGMPYLMYAKSLIALAQYDNKVVELSEREEDEEEEDEEVVDDIIDENKNDRPDTEQSDGVECSNGPTNENEGDKPKPEEDEPVDLMVAWEVLEIAAQIFSRQGESKLSNLADVYAELASISIENGNYQEAIFDYKRAADIRHGLPENNRRILAEIHYKIGLANMMLQEFNDSIEQMQEACKLIELEIQEAERIEIKTEKIMELISELKDTKRDIFLKIVEIEDTKKQSLDEVKKELSILLNKQPLPSGNGSSKSDVDTPLELNDISHLIKRRRPVENEVGEVASKKRTT